MLDARRSKLGIVSESVKFYSFRKGQTMEEQENIASDHSSKFSSRESNILEAEILKNVLDQFYLNNFYPIPRYEKDERINARIFLA